MCDMFCRFREYGGELKYELGSVALVLAVSSAKQKVHGYLDDADFVPNTEATLGLPQGKSSLEFTFSRAVARL